MALEDFFTLTEMKAGLTTLDRVEGLINIMLKEKDTDVKDATEMSRQWSTVARTIMCTDNRECLDHFVQLDGLCFINGWLNDIQKCAIDMSDNFVEESTVVLLQALEKLHINYEKLTSSGVGITLKSLLAHHSCVIKDRAKLLLDNWKQHMNSSKASVDIEEYLSAGDCTMASLKQNESRSIETPCVDGVKTENKSTSLGHETSNSGTPNSLSSKKVKDVLNAECGKEVVSAVTSDPEAVKGGTSDTLYSNDLFVVKDKTEPMNGDANPDYTNIGTQSPSNSRRKAGAASLEWKGEVLADVEDKTNGITITSVGELRDDENPLTSSLSETKGGSLNSVEAKAKETITEASQQDPVMIVSEGMVFQGSICNSLQENSLNGPTEQLSKSLPEEASDSLTAEANIDLAEFEPSHVNAVVQEAEINTRKEVLLQFDLNEEIWSEDVDPSAAPNQEFDCDKVDHHLINQNDIVTSSTGLSSSLKQRQYAHDFDLNVADDEVDRNSDNLPDYVIAVSSSHRSDESCVEIGPRKSKRAELDLNSLGDAPSSACWSKNGLSFGQKNTHRSPSPASSSSSVHPSMWDVDLNKKFCVPNVPCDPQPYLGNSSFNLGDAYGVGRKESFPFHRNGNITGLGNLLPASMNPSPPLHSFIHRPGIPITMVDSRSSQVFPHMKSPAAQPPYLLNIMGAPLVQNGVGSPSYSSFDLNLMDPGKGDEPHPRQYLMSSQGGFLESHSSAISKRKEPHSGWDLYQHGIKHHESPGNT